MALNFLTSEFWSAKAWRPSSGAGASNEVGPDLSIEEPASADGVAMLGPLLKEIQDIRASIPSLTVFGNQPRFAPPLWNDLSRGIQAPLEPIGKLIENQSKESPFTDLLLDALQRLTPSHRTELEAMGRDAILAEAEADALPVPAGMDRQNYFVNMDLIYWISGLADRNALLALAKKYGLKIDRFLDFGCSSGRVLRHFPRAGISECYGADLCLSDIDWLRHHLPTVTPLQCAVLPPLPLEDNCLDMIHAGSVFTHIAEFEEAWLCELRRVLKPGGLAYLTIHPERIWAEMSSENHILTRLLLSTPHRVEPSYETFTLESVRGSMPYGRMVFRVLCYPVNNTNVVHSDEWIETRWGRVFELVERIPRAHGDHQDAILLRKR